MKLHLGCGNIHLDGWINIDARNTDAADMVMDISKLDHIENGSVDLIYACHVLEHFKLVGVNSYLNVLSNWVSKLKSGGIIQLSVPNFDSVLKGINDYRLDRSKTFDFLRLCFGGQDYIENHHGLCFTYEYLKYDMESVGLTNIQTFWPFIDDTSRFNLHGIDVSLNYQGTKK